MSDTTPPKARQAKKKISASNGEAVNDKPLPAPFNNALPSQLELATLAAALHSAEDEPHATAARALALWQASGGVLMEAILEKREMRESLEKIQMFGVHREPFIKFPKAQQILNGKTVIAAKIETVPLEQFLKPFFSKNSKHAHMLKKYRDFQRERIDERFWDYEDPLTDEELLDRVAKEIEKHRTEGVPIFEAIDFADEFKEFLERNGKALGKEKGLKGAAAKKAKAEKAKAEAEKAAKKTAAKKNPLEARATARKRPKQKKAGRKQ
jgi:hypothetical protein